MQRDELDRVLVIGGRRLGVHSARLLFCLSLHNEARLKPVAHPPLGSCPSKVTCRQQKQHIIERRITRSNANAITNQKCLDGSRRTAAKVARSLSGRGLEVSDQVGAILGLLEASEHHLRPCGGFGGACVSRQHQGRRCRPMRSRLTENVCLETATQPRMPPRLTCIAPWTNSGRGISLCKADQAIWDASACSQQAYGTNAASRYAGAHSL